MTDAHHDEAGLLAAVTRYERALMADDVAVLDELFAPGPATLRARGTGVLVGAEHIAAFRAARGGAPAPVAAARARALDGPGRRARRRRVRARARRRVQTQWWHRDEAGSWRVHAAHVSGGPSPRPSTPPPRTTPHLAAAGGAPLVAGAQAGPLLGLRVAVKDLVAVAGQRVGGRRPRLAGAGPLEPAHAPALQRLLDAGAQVAGNRADGRARVLPHGRQRAQRHPCERAGPRPRPPAGPPRARPGRRRGTADPGWAPTPPVRCASPAPTAACTPGGPPTASSRRGRAAAGAGLRHGRAAGPRRGDVAAGRGGRAARRGHRFRRPEALLRSQFLTGLADRSTALAVDAALAALSVATGLPVRDVEVPAGAPRGLDGGLPHGPGRAGLGEPRCVHRGQPRRAVALGRHPLPAGALSGPTSWRRPATWSPAPGSGSTVADPGLALPAEHQHPGPAARRRARGVRGARARDAAAHDAGLAVRRPRAGPAVGRVGELPVGLCVLRRAGPTPTCSDCWRRWGRPDGQSRSAGVSCGPVAGCGCSSSGWRTRRLRLFDSFACGFSGSSGTSSWCTYRSTTVTIAATGSGEEGAGDAEEGAADGHRPDDDRRVQCEGLADEQRLQDVALELLHEKDDPQHDERLDPAEGHEGDEDREDPRDDGPDDGDEGREEDGHGQRQGERDPDDRHTDADEDGVDEGDGGLAEDVAAQRGPRPADPRAVACRCASALSQRRTTHGSSRSPVGQAEERQHEDQRSRNVTTPEPMRAPTVPTPPTTLRAIACALVCSSGDPLVDEVPIWSSPRFRATGHPLLHLSAPGDRGVGDLPDWSATLGIRAARCRRRRR